MCSVFVSWNIKSIMVYDTLKLSGKQIRIRFNKGK